MPVLPVLRGSGLHGSLDPLQPGGGRKVPPTHVKDHSASPFYRQNGANYTKSYRPLQARRQQNEIENAVRTKSFATRAKQDLRSVQSLKRVYCLYPAIGLTIVQIFCQECVTSIFVCRCEQKRIVELKIVLFHYIDCGCRHGHRQHRQEHSYQGMSCKFALCVGIGTVKLVCGSPTKTRCTCLYQTVKLLLPLIG